jgi:hypothetical protein
MSATDKIAREILTGETGDFDLANYDTAQVDTLCREVGSTLFHFSHSLTHSFTLLQQHPLSSRLLTAFQHRDLCVCVRVCVCVCVRVCVCPFRVPLW